jgi:uncharacterized protein (TIGR02118 family)
MFQLTAFYAAPTRPAEFDEHYSTVHIEIVRRLPGLRHATVNWPRQDADGDPAPYHLVAVLYWDDRASALDALASPAGIAAATGARNLECAQRFTIFATSEEVVPFSEVRPGTEVCGVLGLYEKPADPIAFRRHYEQTHSVLAAKMPLQMAFTVNWTAHEAGEQEPRYHLIGNQEWATHQDFDLCLESAEAAAAIADLETFADAGMTILSCRSLIVV